MIVHVILFKPRGDLAEDKRRHLIDALASAAAAIPSVVRLRIGRRVKHGLPGYEQQMAEDYGFAALVEVENLAGLQAYLRHPAHAALGEHFSSSASSALAYDYEMVEARDAPGLGF